MERLTEKQEQEIEKLSMPIAKWLKENLPSYAEITIDTLRFEISTLHLYHSFAEEDFE